MSEMIQSKNGARRWYRDGRLHREDGPAIERADGTREWWLFGRRYETEAEFVAAGGNVG